MGLLDDLKNQAENKKAIEQADAERKAKAEAFYREKILPRMVKAYQYLSEFVNHLKYIEHETIVDYPILPLGKTQSFRQEDYKVVIDSSKNLKKIDFSMLCTLETPVQFELYGKEVVLSHADRIEQYSIKHERKNRKGPSMEIESAKFIVTGPLPLRVSLEADINAGNIKLTIRNFVDPGFSNYTLSVEQFDDDFLDRLGRFVLRQDMHLFGKEEMDEQELQKLRQKMAEEAKQRQQELEEAEARAKAEEEAAAANTTKEQLKRAMNSTVEQGKENLKGMFSKIKQTAAQIAEQNAKKAEEHKAKQAELKRQKEEQQKAKQAELQKRQLEQQKAKQAEMQRQQLEQQKAKQAEMQRQQLEQQKAKQAEQQKVNLQSKLDAQLKNKQATNPVGKPVTARPSAAPVNKTEPPRVFQASSDNPFLKPEDMMTPEQIKEQAEKEKKLKEQTLADRIAEKARANMEAQSANKSANKGNNVQATTENKAAPAMPQTTQAKPEPKPAGPQSVQAKPAAPAHVIANKKSAPPAQANVTTQKPKPVPVKPSTSPRPDQAAAKVEPAISSVKEPGFSLSLEDPAQVESKLDKQAAAAKAKSTHDKTKLAEKAAGLSLVDPSEVVVEQENLSINEAPDSKQQETVSASAKEKSDPKSTLSLLDERNKISKVALAPEIEPVEAPDPVAESRSEDVQTTVSNNDQAVIEDTDEHVPESLELPLELNETNSEFLDLGVILDEQEHQDITSDDAVENKIETEPKAEATPGPEPEVKPEPKAEATPGPEPEVKPEPKAEATFGPEPEMKPEPKAEATPGPEPEVKPEPKAEATPGPEPEVKPGPKAEATPGPEPEVKPEPKAEVKPEPKPKVNTEVEQESVDLAPEVGPLEAPSPVAEAETEMKSEPVSEPEADVVTVSAEQEHNETSIDSKQAQVEMDSDKQFRLASKAIEQTKSSPESNQATEPAGVPVSKPGTLENDLEKDLERLLEQEDNRAPSSAKQQDQQPEVNDDMLAIDLTLLDSNDKSK